MRELEQLLALFIAAVILAAGARRLGAPYPVFLAIGGALLAFLPAAPSFTLPPELALALFVAPVLLDAAYDASVRDLRDNWAPVMGLVVVAVGLTTFAVAVVARMLMPSMPWAPAIVLGAVVAPPDARRRHGRAPPFTSASSNPDDPRGRKPRRSSSLSPAASWWDRRSGGSCCNCWIVCSMCRPQSSSSSSPRSAFGSSPNRSGCQPC
jgi:hypothetical protein